MTTPSLLKVSVVVPAASTTGQTITSTPLASEDAVAVAAASSQDGVPATLVAATVTRAAFPEATSITSPVIAVPEAP